METKKIDWIIKAKGVSILGVVAYHTAGLFDNFKFSIIANSGVFCVQVFLIISAYLTFLSLEKNKEWNTKKYFNYFFHKLLRLMPTLYLVCLFYFIQHCIVIKRFPASNDGIWLSSFFALTFLNGFSYNFINSFMNWYIGDLVIFYAIAPFIKKIIDTPKKSIILFILSIFISDFCTIILEKLGFDITGYFNFWFIRNFPVLTLGIIFFYFTKYKDDVAISSSVYTFLFIISFGFFVSKGNNRFFENRVQIAILLFIMLYILFDKLETGKLFNFLNTFGDHSYGIYLIHGCVLLIIRKYEILSNNTLNFIIYYFIVLLSSLFISMVLNKFIEVPFWNLTKRKQYNTNELEASKN